MFEIIFITAVGIYFLILIYLTSGISSGLPICKEKPFVSVIVAARDEEKNINACLTSLSRQDYPDFEVIIADDYSTDNTGKLIDDFILSDKRFRKVIPPHPKNVPGKTNALISAISITSGDIFLFTDADCEVNEKWISAVVKYFTPETGMVNGYSTSGSQNILTGIQSVDLIFLISVAAGMANNGKPASCIGNNMSIRKNVYDEIGGFGNISSGLTEDYDLINAAAKLKKYNIVFPADENILVKTAGESSWGGLLSQKKRWASGGLKNINVSIFLMITAFIVNLLSVYSLIFYSSKVLSILIFRIASDLFFLFNIHKKFNLVKNLKYFIFFEVYYMVYTLIIPLTLLFNKKIRWKGREY